MISISKEKKDKIFGNTTQWYGKINKIYKNENQYFEFIRMNHHYQKVNNNYDEKFSTIMSAWFGDPYDSESVKQYRYYMYICRENIWNIQKSMSKTQFSI